MGPTLAEKEEAEKKQICPESFHSLELGGRQTGELAGLRGLSSPLQMLAPRTLLARCFPLVLSRQRWSFAAPPASSRSCCSRGSRYLLAQARAALSSIPRL